MKSLEELAMTKTTDVDDFFEKIILKRIEKVAEARRFGRQLTRIFDLKGEATDSITIAKETSIPLPSDVPEGESIIPDKISLEPQEIKLTKRWGYGLAISQEAIDDCQFDLVEEGIDRVGRGFALKEDSFIFDTLLKKTLVTDESHSGQGANTVYTLSHKPLITVTKVLKNSTDITSSITAIDYYDGKVKLSEDCSGYTVKFTYSYADLTLYSDVATKGTLAYEDIIDALYKCKAENEEPSVLVVNPKSYKDLLKDTKFIDASKYGDNKPILKGEIGQISGLRVVTTTQIPESVALILDPTRYAYLLVKGGLYHKFKEEPSNASHELYFFMRIGGDIVNSKAGVLITNLGTLATDLS